MLGRDVIQAYVKEENPVQVPEVKLVRKVQEYIKAVVCPTSGSHGHVYYLQHSDEHTDEHVEQDMPQLVPLRMSPNKPADSQRRR